MSPARTPGSYIDAAKSAAQRVIPQYKEDTGFSFAQLAAAVGRDASTVGDWVSGAKPVPLWLLAHPGVPERLRDRLRGIAPGGERAAMPVERMSSLLVGAAGTAIGVIAAALTDDVMTPDEQRNAAPFIREVRDRCNQWLDRFGGGQ